MSVLDPSRLHMPCKSHWQRWPHHQLVVAEGGSPRYTRTKDMMPAPFAILRGKTGQCRWIIFPTRTDRPRQHPWHSSNRKSTQLITHWYSSPISISFLGLSKYIISSALCTSVSSPLSYWHCFCTHCVWCHQSKVQQRVFLFWSLSLTHVLSPGRDGQASGFLLQIIQFTLNKLAVKSWTCPSVTDVAAERTAPI